MGLSKFQKCSVIVRDLLAELEDNMFLLQEEKLLQVYKDNPKAVKIISALASIELEESEANNYMDDYIEIEPHNNDKSSVFNLKVCVNGAKDLVTINFDTHKYNGKEGELSNLNDAFNISRALDEVIRNKISSRLRAYYGVFS